MDQTAKGLQDYIALFRRRMWQVVIPFAAVLAITLAVALVLPPVYRSAATILIEEPDVPRELVTSTITSFADQRLQIINQRVMATQNLLDILRKYDLYADKRRDLPLSEVIEDMREDIGMHLISAEVRDPKSGGPTKATIAFKVSFDHGRPDIAQRVANEVVSLYLSENLRERQEKATETAAFLQSEATRLEGEIAGLERQLAELKQKFAGSLPEQLEYTMQVIGRAEQELRDLDRQLQSLDEREIFLQAELSRLNPYGSYVVEGQPVLSPSDQLKALRTQLITLSGRYGSDHPDVLKLQREVDALEREAGGGADAAVIARELERVRVELGIAREKYTEDHPDVAKLRRQEASLIASQQSARRAPARVRADQPPDNPAYVQINAQLEAVRADRRATARQITDTKRKLAQYEERIAGMPLVEKDYQHLTRAFESATAEYRDIKNKLMAADLGRALETERKGERFSLLEPPLLPTRPIKPKRWAIVALGLVLAVLAGMGSALLLDTLDTAVYSPRQIATLTGSAPLVVIPYIETAFDRMRARRRRTGLLAAGTAGLVAAIALVHYAVLPLDVAWSRIGRLLDKLIWSMFG